MSDALVRTALEKRALKEEKVLNMFEEEEMAVLGMGTFHTWFFLSFS